MSPIDLNHCLFIAQKALAAGEKILKKHFGRLKKIDTKSSKFDLVTEADKNSEKAILSVLQKAFPTHSFICEEQGGQKSSDYLWLIDPLDGTTNYTHTYPMFAISIALAFHNKVILALVKNPSHQELFWALRGFGAFLNDRKISCSKTQEIEKSLLATGFAYDRRTSPENNYKAFTFFTQLTQGVRRSGSAALDLAYVASGRLDGYWEKSLGPWDIAAGSLLVEEAGGRVTDYDKKPLDLFSGRIVATNGPLHEEIQQRLPELIFSGGTK